MFEFLIKKLKAHPRKIVFTEGTDPRILEASARQLSWNHSNSRNNHSLSYNL